MRTRHDTSRTHGLGARLLTIGATALLVAGGMFVSTANAATPSTTRCPSHAPQAHDAVAAPAGIEGSGASPAGIQGSG